MGANEYNKAKLDSGDLSIKNVTTLIEAWQRNHPELAVDGHAGPNTIASLSPKVTLEKVYPLACLEDGRKPVITSGFHTENGSRPGHDGVDFFYKWLDKDPAVFAGHGGAIKRNGKRRWWYPDGALALAAAAGVIQEARMTRTGFKIWLDHGNGERTGYFHGEKGLVAVGDRINAGQAILVVGDNPNGGYKKHLHFEVSPVDKYAPKNPRTWLKDAEYQG